MTRLTIGFLAALGMAGTGACGMTAERRGRTVLYASGADLQSINPLLTVHPMARQVQRYVLLTTLARYDSALTPRPYLARAWTWSADRRTLRLRLTTALRWHDGVPTTARDVVWTLEAARDPATGYPRQGDLAAISTVSSIDDSTVALRFLAPQAGFPDVLTDLAILPAHLLDTVSRAAGGLRQAAWNERPVGNGPFRFVAHEPNRRWVFAANPDFPRELGGPPRLERFIVVVVDEPTTKLAALTAGEIDFAGINPAHADFVRRNPDLAVVDYPFLMAYGVVFNTRRPPFDDRALRRRLSQALDRRQIVDGYLFGFGTPADGPVPPSLPQYVATAPVGIPDSSALDSRVAFELLTVGSGEAALEQLIQSQLAPAGFDVRIRQLELSAYLDRVYGSRHEFQAAVVGTPGDLGLGYVGALARLAGIDVPGDATAAQRTFAEQVPVAFLYHGRGVQGMNRRVRNVTMDLRGELPTVTRWEVAP